MKWTELDFEDENVKLPPGATLLLGLDAGPRRNRATPLFSPNALETLNRPCIAGHIGTGFLSSVIETTHRDATRYRILLLWSSYRNETIRGKTAPFSIVSSHGFLGVAVIRQDSTSQHGESPIPELAALCTRRGYGAFLLGEARRFVRETWGATQLRVDATRESRGFYTRHGFKWIRALGQGFYVPMIGTVL